MQIDIFISYSREDKAIVLPFIDKINKEVGTQCWIDLDGIESGEQFENKIIQAIDSAQIVLFVLSDNSLKSDWTTIFEANGAAFLPATGYRDGTRVDNEGEIGYYWSQTPFDNAKAYYVFIEDCSLTPSYHAYGRADGRGVRLVCDVEK